MKITKTQLNELIDKSVDKVLNEMFDLPEEVTKVRDASAKLGKIDLSLVKSVYSGKLGCMCGCQGSYYVMPGHPASPGVKLSQKMVNKVISIIEQNWDSVDHGTNNEYFEQSGRCYVIYYDE